MLRADVRRDDRAADRVPRQPLAREKVVPRIPSLPACHPDAERHRERQVDTKQDKVQRLHNTAITTSDATAAPHQSRTDNPQRVLVSSRVSGNQRQGFRRSLEMPPHMSRWERENPWRSPLMTTTTLAARSPANPSRHARCSLSQRERVRVRENLPTECEGPFLETLPRRLPVDPTRRLLWESVQKHETHTLDAHRSNFDAYRNSHTSHISIAHSKSRHHSGSLFCCRASDAGRWRD